MNASPLIHDIRKARINAAEDIREAHDFGNITIINFFAWEVVGNGFASEAVYLDEADVTRRGWFMVRFEVGTAKVEDAWFIKES